MVYKHGQAGALEMTSALVERLNLEGKAWVRSTGEVDPDMAGVEDTDLIITVGGDGTIIRAARLAVPHGIPILGINMGRLGFMTELEANEALDMVPQYLEGMARVEERSMLRVDVTRPRGARKPPSLGGNGSYHALNDAVVGRGATSRVVRIRALIDGAHLTDFRADAVIVCTATGSTGYNLAVGGPILPPQATETILKAVAPHVGLAPALVLPASCVVQLIVDTDHQAMLSVDGFQDEELAPGDGVVVRQSHLKALFLRAHPPTHYYETLTRRLGFGGGQSSTRAIQY
jgi:NAD+ kinase